MYFIGFSEGVFYVKMSQFIDPTKRRDSGSLKVTSKKYNLPECLFPVGHGCQALDMFYCTIYYPYITLIQ